MQKLILIGIIGMLFSGCATITSGTTQSVFVDTPKIKGAECRLTDSKGNSWYLPYTPGNVTVLKGDGPMNVVCEKKGYNDGIANVEESISGATFSNILIGGGIGIFIDSMSGAAQKYPPSVVIWMRPEEWESETQKLEWEKGYVSHQDAIKKVEEEQTASANCSNQFDGCD